MKGITDGFTIPEAAVKAVQAGSDLILICHSPDQQMAALEALIRAVEKGTIKEERINESLARVLSLKEHFLLPRRSPKPKQVKERVGCDAHRSLVEEIAKRGEPVPARRWH